MTTTDPPALKLEHLTKHYGKYRGIHDISLEVERGEVFGLLGPGGAGKSTVVYSILDLLRPQRGKINVLGLDHRKDAKQVRTRLGYFSNAMKADPTLTGRQYLNYIANLRGGAGKDVITSLAQRLRSDTGTKIRHLSRSNRYKISLIAALMHEPDVLILDEPAVGLDPFLQTEFQSLIREHKEKGGAAFISSRNFRDIQEVCDRVGFIRGGKIIHVSSLDTLRSRASRHVSVRFRKDEANDEISKLDGAHNFTREDTSVHFSFNGDIDRLLKLLAGYHIENISIDEPDLEELFMDLYRKKEHHV